MAVHLKPDFLSKSKFSDFKELSLRPIIELNNSTNLKYWILNLNLESLKLNFTFQNREILHNEILV